MGKSTILMLALIALLSSACAAAPKEELHLAREALAQARTAGAEELAPHEFQNAQAALQNCENLILYKNYKLAREILPLAASLSYRATFKAREERLRIESAKKLEELQKQEEIAKKVQPFPDGLRRQKEPHRIEAVKEKKTPAPPPLSTQYEVKKEESLWVISALKEVYSDPLLWPIIYKANRDQIKDPRQVYPGQVLAIPRSTSTEDKEEARREARQSEFFPAERSTIPP